ncbi:2429_t:CDS:2 [Scutellospora calospora]|uniref:2429_t:CDS:1 n=1 Tax=Scutellospora calospora TaxID=85575 RepID=A0ACA9L8Z9_9GLOM|nr:2429_t:CDS:2 [Scutellospora calospora]
MNQYIDRLLDISLLLKNNQLYFLESSNIFSDYLNHEKKLHKNYIENNGLITSLIKLSNISDDAKKKFENQRLEILHKLEDEINNSGLSNNKIEELYKLRKNRLAKFANNKIKQLENKIKIAKTIEDIDDIFNELIYDKILPAEERDNITTLSQNKLEEIRDILINEIKKEIEKSNDAKQLLDKKLDEKIKKLNLSEDDTKKLEKILNDKIFSIIKKINDGFLNKIKKLQTKKDLDNLKKIVTKHELLSNKQKEIIKNNIDQKITEIKKDSQPETPNPNEEILIKEIEKNIIEINKDNVEKLLDDKDIDKKIKSLNLSSTNIKKLQESRKNKLSKLRTEIYDQYINKLNTEKNIILLTNFNNNIIKNKVLTNKQINDISTLIIEKITKINENNEIYDKIKIDINRFQIPDNLDDFIKKNIDSFNEEYLSNNRDKLSLNKYYMEK